MGYKFKPNKGVAKRMRLTATGKLKHRHEKNSHLRSRRNSALKRRVGRPGVLSEGLARNMRRLLGQTGTRPNQIAAERATAEKKESTTTTTKKD
jgi:large subunit ribosomal protein L35